MMSLRRKSQISFLVVGVLTALVVAFVWNHFIVSKRNDALVTAKLADIASERISRIDDPLTYMVYQGALAAYQRRFGDLRYELRMDDMLLVAERSTARQEDWAPAVTAIANSYNAIRSHEPVDYTAGSSFLRMSLRGDLADENVRDAAVLLPLIEVETALIDGDFSRAEAFLTRYNGREAFATEALMGHFLLVRGYWLDGQINKARAALQEALPMAREVADKRTQIHLVFAGAFLANAVGEPDVALRLAEYTIEIAEDSGDEGYLAEAIIELARFHVMLGNIARANEWLGHLSVNENREMLDLIASIDAQIAWREEGFSPRFEQEMAEIDNPILAADTIFGIYDMLLMQRLRVRR